MIAPNGQVPTPPVLSIRGDDQRELLAVRAANGRLEADYRPEDLDDAARRFVAHLREVFLGSGVPLHPAVGDRVAVQDGDGTGTLVLCGQCSGKGLLFRPDTPPAVEGCDR